MRRFYISKRKASSYLMAEFFDPQTGRRIASRSTRTRDRTEAVIIANGWLSTGLPHCGPTPKPISEAFSISELISALKEAPLTPSDAQKVLSVLTDRGLRP
jgi:hypothetical protein